MSINELYFRTIDFLRLRKRAYQLTFPNPERNEVLKDLAKFCHANEVPKVGGEYLLGVANGRREVWLRIQQHVTLTPEQLFQIFNGPSTLVSPQAIAKEQ